MANIGQGQAGQQHDNSTDWKTGVVVVLTIIFVALYVIGLSGWFAFTPNDKVVGPVAPIIAVIIGYYFGRLPSEKTEKSLQQQVNQRSQEAAQARNAHQQAATDRERLATKIEDAKAALSSAAPAAPPDGLAITLSGGGGAGPDLAALRGATVAALKVLES